jgi:hypothetical protein
MICSEFHNSVEFDIEVDKYGLTCCSIVEFGYVLVEKNESELGPIFDCTTLWYDLSPLAAE